MQFTSYFLGQSLPFYSFRKKNSAHHYCLNNILLRLMGQEELNTSGEHEDTQFIMTWGLLQDAVGREAV